MLCIDYEALYKIMMKNQYHVLKIKDFIDQLYGVKQSSKLDKKTWHYQMGYGNRNEYITWTH
jgi:hypothetical protein